MAACSPGPVEIDQRAAGGEAAEPCAALVAALPDEVAGQPRRSVEPTDAPGAAWGDPPIVLRCSDEKPDGFGRTSACTTVNGVDWYLPEEEVAVEDVGDVTMTTVHRAAFVSVELPAEYWPPAETLVDLADAVAENVPATGRCQ